MMSSANLLKRRRASQSSGRRRIWYWGCYYLTLTNPNLKHAEQAFADFDEVRLAYDLGKVTLHTPIKVKFTTGRRAPAGPDGLSDVLQEAMLRAGLRTAATSCAAC